MNLDSSPKIYNNYKCDCPKNTIKKIEEGFEKLGLALEYNEKKVSSSKFSIYLGQGLVDILGWAQHGKGTSHELAKASAFAEMAERFSTGYLEMKMPLPKNYYIYQNLLKYVNDRQFLDGFIKDVTYKHITIELLNNYFQRKITSEEFNLFKKEKILDDMVDAYSFIKNQIIKVPINCIELNSLSNGLASGNTKEEAIAQASFEIFERYLANKIVNEQIQCPTIDNSSINNEEVQKCIEMFESFNIDVKIKDFTLGNKIPVMGVLFTDNNLDSYENRFIKDRDFKRISVGSHINLNEAIMRCFSENLQSLGFSTKELMSREKQDILYKMWIHELGYEYKKIEDKEKFKYFTKEWGFFDDYQFLEDGKQITFDSLNSSVNPDSLDDVNTILKICKDFNWDFLVIDYTHKILKFPTVRVIIPPISIDFDQFTKKIMNYSTLEERINFLYGIKDFYRFITNDDWIKDKNQINQLINNITNYLSSELYYYSFYINRANNFFQQVNLFHILAILCIAAEEYNLSIKYFKILLNLDFKPQVPSSYQKSLYLTKYNSAIYEKYIELLQNFEKNDSFFKYELKTNPFDPDSVSEELDYIYRLTLKNINESFK